jgi:hypothetical protein
LFFVLNNIAIDCVSLHQTVAAHAAMSISQANAEAARRSAENARLAALRAQDQAQLNSERLRDQQALDAARARDVQAVTTAATKVQVAAVKTDAAVARQRETIAAMTAAQNAAQQARVFEAKRQEEAETRHAQEQLQLQLMDEHRRAEKLAETATRLRVEHERLVAAEHARAAQDERDRRQNQWELREVCRVVFVVFCSMFFSSSACHTVCSSAHPQLVQESADSAGERAARASGRRRSFPHSRRAA